MHKHMFSERIKVRFESGDREDITLSGQRGRKPTVLITFGGYSFPKQAFFLGLFLCICQVLDGLLTYVGLKALGIEMEGNAFLREMMHLWGQTPVLLIAKMFALIMAIALTVISGTRKWIRPLIALLVLIYLVLAIIPWTYINVSKQAANQPAQYLPEP